MLGSLHLTLMAVLGVWLWRDLQTFGVGNQEPATFMDANRLALKTATIAILGQGVPLGSSALQGTSIAIYSISLVPGVNLIPPMLLFLTAYLACHRISLAKRWDVFPAFVALGVLLAINLVFIVDIEVTRNMNSKIQADDEANWGFAQILTILLLLSPLRDLVEAIIAHKFKQCQRELDEDLREAIERQEFDQAKRAIERGSVFPSPQSTGNHSLNSAS
jgi:hypothetical protein